jgi:hypothetical protein
MQLKHCLLAALILAAFMSPVITMNLKLKTKQVGHSHITKNAKVSITRLSELHKPQLDACPFCVNLMDQTLNQLLNIILNVGVLGSCNQLCNYLSEYGTVAVMGCNLLCDYVGIEGFIKLINMAELDPIWMCDEIGVCTVNDCKAKTCALFENTRVSPQKAHKGDNVTLTTILNVLNATSTGELEFLVLSNITVPIVDGELVSQGFKPGRYAIQVVLPLVDQDDPDFPVIFGKGKYQFNVEACEGLCGNHHSHERRLAKTSPEFEIV